MTMFPAHNHNHHQQNLSKQNRYRSFVGGCGGDGSSDGRTYLAISSGGCVSHEYCSVSDQACVGSDLIMAEDESRTESNNNEAGSSSKEEDKDDRGWLQLSVGGHTNITNSSSYDHVNLDRTTTSREGGGLDLLPPGNGGGVGGNYYSQQATFRPFNLVPGPVLRPTNFHLPEFGAPPPPFPANYASSFLQQHLQGTAPSSSNTISAYHQETNNYMAAFRTTGTSGNIITPSSFPSLVAAPGSYFARPFHVHSGGGNDVAGRPSLDFRVVEPPRRPQSAGVWFMLLASPNQVKEPYLPQISKSYIRIKDGRMTIRLLIKYLVNKLSLDEESEIEVRCRGEELLPFLTLQHVRDNIWRRRRNFISSTTSPRRNDVVPVSTNLLPYCSTPPTTTDHLMVLHYGRNIA